MLLGAGSVQITTAVMQYGYRIIDDLLEGLNEYICISCGRCYRSCMDGGHQAIELDPETRRPRLNGKRCVGCHLCMLVCKVGAIRPGEKVVRRT